MTIAKDIINRKMPNFDYYLKAGESLDDIDEYGFTPLIEAVITRQPKILEQLLLRKVDVNKPDVTGRTALHWAVDNYDLYMADTLLRYRANPNAYTSAGLSVLVYPVLREQNDLKQLLYQHDAKLDFALDFIYAKLLGHRFELMGDVDIVNATDEFIEVDFEGFILEFTVGILQDSLRRFTSSYATRSYREFFPFLHVTMDAFAIASELLQLQHVHQLTASDIKRFEEIVKLPMLILPAASRGHALGFIKYKNWWAKIDRGENSIKEGCINIYKINKPEAFNALFLQDFLYKKQTRDFFHRTINKKLDLRHFSQIPIEPQISGNCSWANIQATVLVSYALQELDPKKFSYAKAKEVYAKWIDWDKDRALDECCQRFYLVDDLRKASYVSMLAAVLFQASDHSNIQEVRRAEKILNLLTITDYKYILDSYLEVYCSRRLTKKGNNLLQILEECAINPNIGVSAVATGLKKRDER